MIDQKVVMYEDKYLNVFQSNNIHCSNIVISSKLLNQNVKLPLISGFLCTTL